MEHAKRLHGHEGERRGGGAEAEERPRIGAAPVVRVRARNGVLQRMLRQLVRARHLKL